jgi:hypothetical protein
VLNPCDFKDWSDPKFSGRAKQVIQNLVAMNGSVSKLLVHFHAQWDEMLDYRQHARQQIRELKATASDLRSCSFRMPGGGGGDSGEVKGKGGFRMSACGGEKRKGRIILSFTCVLNP